MIERRSLIKGLVALVAAPAIVKVASLMPVNAALHPADAFQYMMINKVHGFIDQMVRHVERNVMEYEADCVQARWSNSPGFVARVHHAYDEQFGADGAKIGDVLRIRLPNDYIVSDHVQHPADAFQYMMINKVHGFPIQETIPLIPDKLALAAVAVAAVPALLEKPVTRRFWSTK